MVKIKTFLQKDIPIKVGALMCAFGCWYLCNTLQVTTASYKIPVHFHSTDSTLQFKHQPTIAASIQASKAALYTTSADEMIVYLDGSQFTRVGTYKIVVKPEDIIIPPSVKLLHYSPAVLEVSLTT